eukprot:4402450-Amphidinium_carterae.1
MLKRFGAGPLPRWQAQMGSASLNGSLAKLPATIRYGKTHRHKCSKGKSACQGHPLRSLDLVLVPVSPSQLDFPAHMKLTPPLCALRRYTTTQPRLSLHQHRPLECVPHNSIADKLERQVSIFEAMLNGAV